MSESKDKLSVPLEATHTQSSKRPVYEKRSNLFQFKFPFNPDTLKFPKSNTEALEWMAQMERHISICPSTSDLDHIVFLSGNLEGSARTKLIKAPKTNAVDFLKWFASLYCKEKVSMSEYIYKDIQELRQTGKLSKYQAEFGKLETYNSICNPPIQEKLMIAMFIDGLQDKELRRYLSSQELHLGESESLENFRELASQLVEKGFYYDFS